MLDIGCHVRYVAADQVIPAAVTAIAQNPGNAPATNMAAGTGVTLPAEHLAVLTSRYWGAKGVKLTVGFTEQIQDDLANRLLSHMNAWSQYANVEFTRTKTDPQVRISRGGGGYWSYLGTDILHIPANQQTMNLEGFTMQMPESEFIRVVRHETGHTLGAPHEHMRPAIINRLDPEKTIAYFMATQGWSRQMVIDQVLTPLDESTLKETTAADEASIMTYMLPGQITKDGRPVVGGTDIDANDQAFIGTIYPKAVVPPPPPPPGPPATDKWLPVIEAFARMTGHVVHTGGDIKQTDECSIALP